MPYIRFLPTIRRLLICSISLFAITMVNEVSSEELDGQIIWGVPDSRSEADTQPLFFRKTFKMPNAVGDQPAILSITCDDGYRVFLNGVMIGEDKAWNSIERYDVSALLRGSTGTQAIAVQAENGSVSPAGLFVNLSVGGKTIVASDKSWRCSKIPTPGWRFADFEGGSWKQAFAQGAIFETAPWGDRFVVADTITSVAVAKTEDSNRLGTELLDGDRVVFLGGTFIERMQTTDYVETWLTANCERKSVTFRNLGWSGDNVFGLSRAVFGNQADGLRRLENDVRIADPTLIVVSYGRNESFRGREYLPQFLEGLRHLIDVLETTGADIFLLSPMLMERLGPPLPNPAKANENIGIYAEAIKTFANRRGLQFIDFRRPLGRRAVSRTDIPAIRDRLTDNGMHLNDYGYWRIAPELAKTLGVQRKPVAISIDASSKSFAATGTTVAELSLAGNRIEFTAVDDKLPFCPPPEITPQGGELMAPHDLISVTGLPAGKYGLKINGRPTILAGHEQWAAGVRINRGQYLEQAKELRKLIKRKNEMFFHRYRPQNETYLFLFRKHEQGNNAVEVPQFDPIITDLERQIANTKIPRPVTYLLQKVDVPSTKN